MTPQPEGTGPLLYAPQETIRILFVDDDPILREFAVVNLSGEHALIRTAADGASALAAIEAETPDIVLISLEAPGYEALAVLKALRADPSRSATPVIAVTGREDMAAVDQAYAAGAAAFAVKPLNWRLLGRQVRFVLRRTARPAAQAPDAADGGDRLVNLAQAGVRFIAQAVATEPRLKSAAIPFAEAADAVMARKVSGG